MLSFLEKVRKIKKLEKLFVQIKICCHFFWQVFDKCMRWCSEGTMHRRAKNIFAAPSTKTAEYEVKNRHKSAEEAKAEHLLFVNFCYLLN